MKKVTFNAAKLQLNKEKVTSLNHKKMADLVGGGNEANPNNPTANSRKITKEMDVPTIGHDDGAGCLSASDWGWCWCHGI